MSSAGVQSGRMQELCKTKLGWDQPLEGELLKKWKHLVNDLKTSQPVVLP